MALPDPSDVPSSASSPSSERFVALQHRDFRLVWIAQMIAVIGLQMQTIAVNWHVYTLLRDVPSSLQLFGIPLAIGALGLGGLGLARWLPLLPFSIMGGLMADSHNRRRILLVTTIMGSLTAAL